MTTGNYAWNKHTSSKRLYLFGILVSSRSYARHWIAEDILHYELPLVSDFQAKAIWVKLWREMTICKIYVNHELNFTQANLQVLFNQLPAPFLVLGDFNSKIQCGKEMT